MGMLWTMLLSNLGQHEPAQSETIVETEASTNLTCECCPTRYALRPKKKNTLNMTTVVFVDGRMRTSGTDSDFEVDLRETIHLSNARLRVDKLTFTDSFRTTDAGGQLVLLERRRAGHLHDP